MTIKTLVETIMADFFRYDRQSDLFSFLRCGYDNPGFKFTFWWRICSYLFQKPFLKVLLYYWTKIIFNHYRFKFGIDIPINLNVGKGLYIGHFGGIVIGSEVTIGRNCNISQGVTLGRINRGPKKGSPTIYDNVYIGSGAKVLGNILIGNNVAIGANAVVINDAPDGSVVVGIPGRIVSNNGSQDYITNTDY